MRATAALVLLLWVSFTGQTVTLAAEPGTVTLVFVGDVMLADGPGRAIEAGKDPLAHVQSLLADSDLAVANLECPISTRGVAEDKVYTFRAHPRVVPLAAKHFGAVSLANNHAVDFGREALVDTLDLLKQGGIPYFGAGRDLSQAHAPLILERRGLRVALIGCLEFLPRSFEAGPSMPGVAWCEDNQISRDIEAARAAGADIVIPFVHWGWEGEPEPSERQRELAHRLIEAGADVVVGSHPHVTQPAEVYRGRLIVYSLGNFVFDDFPEGPGRVGWLLRLTLGPQGLVDWRTVEVRLDEQGTPHPKREPIPH